MLKKGKRGSGTFSVQFLIGVVVAIACIIMLSILGAKLYGTFERKTDLQQARVQLDKIIYAVEHLEEGVTRKVLIEGPNDWVLTSFGGNLCICKPDKVKLNFDKLKLEEDCGLIGVCETSLVEVDSVCYLGNDRTPREHPVGECLLIDISEIFVEKEGETLLIKTPQEILAESVLENLLEFRDNSGKSILENSEDYINSDSLDSKNELEISLKDLIVKFFVSEGIEKDWRFFICEAKYQGEVVYGSPCPANIFSFGGEMEIFQGEGKTQKEIIEDNSGKEYLIKLQMGVLV